MRFNVRFRSGRRGRRLLCAAVVAALAAHAAQGADPDPFAPKPPPSAKPGTLTEPAAPPVAAAPAGEDGVLLPELKGLQFVDNVRKIARTGVRGTGILIDPSLSVLDSPAIRARLAAFLGQPLHQSDLKRISQAVTAWYRERHLPVVDVSFPQQDISSGTVQAVVTVYSIGKISIAGNRWFSTGLLRAEMSLHEGDAIDVDTLKADLNTLNRNPFRRVDAVLARSTIVGATDIDVKVTDRFPLRVYASYDDDGLPAIGRNRDSIGVTWGNVLGFDHQISYQFITTPDLFETRNRGPGQSNAPRFMAHSLSYVAPLPWGDSLSVFASYVQMVPDLGPNFGQLGHSFQVSGRYSLDLPSLGALSQQLQLGIDYKRSDNNLAFGGTQIFVSATNVEQAVVSYSGTLTDRAGQFSLQNDFVFSPGGLSHGNTTAVFQAAGVAGAKAGYVYDNVKLTRFLALPADFSAVGRLEAQMASTELLSSEQLGAGGSDSVRGYDPRVANGSQGVLASIELRSPPFRPLHWLGTRLPDSAQLLVFYDYADVSYLNAQQNLPDSAELQSVGVGLRYGIDRFVDLRADYGIQLEKPPGATSLGSLASVSLTISN